MNELLEQLRSTFKVNHMGEIIFHNPRNLFINPKLWCGETIEEKDMTEDMIFTKTLMAIAREIAKGLVDKRFMNKMNDILRLDWDKNDYAKFYDQSCVNNQASLEWLKTNEVI